MKTALNRPAMIPALVVLTLALSAPVRMPLHKPKRKRRWSSTASPRYSHGSAMPTGHSATMSKFNTLANLASPPAPTAPRKLTGPFTGDAANGQKLVADRNRGGGCLACHVMGPAGNADLPGNVGPDLSEIGNAGRNDQWLFNYVYDARVYNAATVMPPWGKHGFYNEQEISDMVAFLKTLKTPAKFANPLDDPKKRPRAGRGPRQARSASSIPAVGVEQAQALCARSKRGLRVLPRQRRGAFKSWAVEMPKWEPRLKKVLGHRGIRRRHAKATSRQGLADADATRTRRLSIYLHSLANGEAIKVDLSAPGARRLTSAA